MKRHVCAFLIAVMALNIIAMAQTAPPEPAPLTNEDVIMLLANGFSPEVVIEKINTSRSDFDTSLDGMAALKKAKVPDSVILAMLHVNGRPPGALGPTAPAPVDVKVLDGQQVEVELSRAATSEDLKVGDVVDFTVTQPVVVNGATIFEKGAPARATITTAKRAGHWGHAGKLEWAMKNVMAADGNRIPVRFTQRNTGDSKGGTVAVAAVATTVLLGPLGLLWGLKKGKPVVIQPGNRYPVFVQGDTTIKGQPIKP